ncbi:unnamed protein product [Symbiodinium sp. CCMP2592]|nr:unnamed protein product [Symbiodinium sp. CCMP2592]
MAASSQVLETMASQLSAVAAGLEALRVQGAEQSAANDKNAEVMAAMQQRISQRDALLTGDGPSVLSTAAPVTRPQDWEVQLPQGAASSQPVSREECAAMITEALQQKVGPVRMLKIRTAWTEKDLMYSQIEAAKRTLVVRNFPEWATADDRELTVAEALKENHLGYLEWDLTATTMEGKTFLAPISILTVPTYAVRKKVMDACSRAVVLYWLKEEEKPKEAVEEEAGQTQQSATPGSDRRMVGSHPLQPESSQRLPTGLVTASSLFGMISSADLPDGSGERSLLHSGLKNLTGVLRGTQAQQARSKASRTGGGPLQVRVPWELTFVGLSQDHPDRQFFQDLRPVEELMAEMAVDQAMETEVAAGESLITFAEKSHSTRSGNTPKPSGEPDLTKEPYYPFDSQAKLDQEVENEKITQISLGYDISKYSTEQTPANAEHNNASPTEQPTGDVTVAGEQPSHPPKRMC